MPIVGAGVAVLLAILLSTFGGTTGAPVVELTATVGEKKDRKTFEYRPYRAEPAPAPAPREPQVLVATPERRAPVEVSAPPLLIKVEEPVAPPESAVSVCLGKTVGSLCTYSGAEGTCLTPSWQPLTCVPH